MKTYQHVAEHYLLYFFSFTHRQNNMSAIPPNFWSLLNNPFSLEYLHGHERDDRDNLERIDRDLLKDDRLVTSIAVIEKYPITDEGLPDIRSESVPQIATGEEDAAFIPVSEITPNDVLENQFTNYHKEMMTLIAKIQPGI